MSGTIYFWQGGRRIAIEEAPAEVTIETSSTNAAENAARDAAVNVDAVEDIGSGLVKMRLAGDRDKAMERLRKSHVVHHVYQLEGQLDAELVISDAFVCKFKRGTDNAEVTRFINDNHLEVVVDYGNGRLLLRVTDATGRNPIRMANAAAERDDVDYAEPNLVRRLTKFDFIPADPLFASQWHLFAPEDGTELVRDAGISAPGAWETTLGVREVVICVADDGCDVTHPDFQGPGKIAGRMNVMPVGSTQIQINDQVMPQAGDYHGTPCTGVAVAENNGTGVVGVAADCALLAVRFPLNISDSQLAEMFSRISLEADVVSCSWGYGPADAPMSTFLRERIAELADNGGRRGRGLIFCVAAGNNNCPVKDLDNTLPYRYVDQFGIIRTYSGPIDRWIAAHPEVITVAASTSLKTRSAYSSWGGEINVCAPSNNFDDLRQESVPGRGITTTDNEGVGPGSDFTQGSRYTGRFGGTSSATPTVAGVCGLVLSTNPELSGAQVRQILETTADQDMVIASDTEVNVPGDFVDGFSPWFGHGKVNAARAVVAALPNGSGTRIDIGATDVPVSIPDRGAAVVSTITVPQSRNIADLRVAVDISHTYRADLRVDLVAPDGTAVNLHNHQGGSADDLVQVYGAAEIPALATLAGHDVHGNWQLRVIDTWFLDEGTIRGWRLVANLVS